MRLQLLASYPSLAGHLRQLNQVHHIHAEPDLYITTPLMPMRIGFWIGKESVLVPDYQCNKKGCSAIAALLEHVDNANRKPCSATAIRY